MATQESYIGSVDLWSVPWAPQGWAICNGQLLSINENQALYSLIGHIYDGGSSQTTFGIPDLCGRVPIGVGISKQPAGLTVYDLGEKGGYEEITLTTDQLPAHLHSANYIPPTYSASGSGTVSPKAKTGLGALTNSPADNYMGPSGSNNIYSTTSNANMGASDVAVNVSIKQETSGSVEIEPTGMSMPHYNIMPYLGLYYIIAVEGIYPPRP